MRLLFVLMFIAVLVGCSSEVERKAAPVSMSGSVSQGGQPFGGIMLVFQPLGDGHVREFPIRKDGTFNGDMASGEYAYFVAKPTLATAAQALKKIPPKYFEADLSRTVTVESGEQLAIALD